MDHKNFIFDFYKRSRDVSPESVRTSGRAGAVEEEESSDDDNGTDGSTTEESDGGVPELEHSEEDDDMGLNNEDANGDRGVGDENELAEAGQDEIVELPTVFPMEPPAPEMTPDFEYPMHLKRSSSAQRNRDWARRLKDSFVAYEPGLKGEPYRKRCDYEHMMIMG